MRFVLLLSILSLSACVNTVAITGSDGKIRDVLVGEWAYKSQSGVERWTFQGDRTGRREWCRKGADFCLDQGFKWKISQGKLTVAYSSEWIEVYRVTGFEDNKIDLFSEREQKSLDLHKKAR